MLNLFYHLLFLVFSVYVLIQSISYGLYEINEQKNNFGGSFVILFSIFSIVFSNLIIWQH